MLKYITTLKRQLKRNGCIKSLWMKKICLVGKNDKTKTKTKTEGAVTGYLLRKKKRSPLSQKKRFSYNRRELSVYFEKESTLECVLQFCPLESNTEENIIKK